MQSMHPICKTKLAVTTLVTTPILERVGERRFGLALCLSVFRDNIGAELLPAYCNWMCDYHLPKYSLKSKHFVEPYLPNNPIACMHLAGMNEARFSNKSHSIETIEGEKIMLKLRFNSR